MILHGTVWSFEAVWYLFDHLKLYGTVWSLELYSPCDISPSCKELMGCMAVVVHTGKHQRCNPEPELKLTSVTLVVSYPFSSSESTLAPLRNNNVSSSWHPELGGALARPSLHQHGP